MTNQPKVKRRITMLQRLVGSSESNLFSPELLYPWTTCPARQDLWENDNRNQCRKSTSYVSWSESARDIGSNPDRRRTKPNAPVDPIGRNISRVYNAHSPLTRKKREVTTTRPRLPSMPPSRRKLSRAHSYPLQSSSSQRANIADQRANPQDNDSQSLPSSMPIFMSANTDSALEQIHVSESEGDAGPGTLSLPRTGVESQRHKQPVFRNGGRSAGKGLSISSDLERTVQECSRAFRQRDQSRLCIEHIIPTVSAAHLEGRERKNSTTSNPTVFQASAVRFADMEGNMSWERNSTIPGIYEQQAQRSRLFQGPLAEESDLPGRNFADLESLDSLDGLDSVDGEGDEIWEEQAPDEWREGSQLCDIEGDDLARHTVQHSTFDRANAMPGFWRPNRLY